MHSLIAFAIYLAASVAGQNTNLQTVFPKSSGTSAFAAAKTIAAGASFDGKMVQYDRNRESIIFHTVTRTDSHLKSVYGILDMPLL